MIPTTSTTLSRQVVLVSCFQQRWVVFFFFLYLYSLSAFNFSTQARVNRVITCYLLCLHFYDLMFRWKCSGFFILLFFLWCLVIFMKWCLLCFEPSDFVVTDLCSAGHSMHPLMVSYSAWIHSLCICSYISWMPCWVNVVKIRSGRIWLSVDDWILFCICFGWPVFCTDCRYFILANVQLF